jgi:PAS domain S-box-containing protein
MGKKDAEILIGLIPAVVYQFLVQPSGGWRFVYLSRQIEDLYGVSAEEAYADHNALTACIVPEDRASHKSTVQDASKNMSLWSHLHRIRTPKGHLKWIHAQAMPQRKDAQSVMWYGVLMDVTWYFQAEQSFFKFLADHEMRVQDRQVELKREVQDLERLRLGLLCGPQTSTSPGDQSTNQEYQTCERDVTFPFMGSSKVNDSRSVLSQREAEVLKLLAHGKTTKQIAEALLLSQATVSAHRRNIRSKLNLHSGADLTRYAVLKFPSAIRPGGPH